MSLQSNGLRCVNPHDLVSLRSGIVPQNRLPQQVFAATTAADYLFFEYTHAFSAGGWHLFLRLAQEYGDPCIWFTILDPDINEYYTKHFGTGSEAWFSATAPATDYVQHMFQWPALSVADAPAYRADVAVWIGETARWRCWGERGPNVCVIQLDARDQHQTESLCNELMRDSANYVPLLTLEEALSDVVSHEYDTTAFEHFARQFRLDYALYPPPSK